jgi:putative integral membrane protein (TIGR02587 family)
MAAVAATWREQLSTELDDFAHGAAGGFLFGVPLLYTMEMWFTGMTISMGHALVLVALTVLLSVGFVVTIGFRRASPPRFRDVLAEAFDAVAISLVVTVACLGVLGRIGPATPLDIALGRIAIELLPVSLGVAIANHILPSRGSRSGEEEDRDAATGHHETLRDLTVSAGGALLLSLNIAPTDEVQILAGELSELQLVGLLAFALIITYVIVFEAGFRNQQRRRQARGAFQTPLTETVVAYLLSLAVCYAILRLLGSLPADAALGTVLSHVVVLGFPAALGAAAGRLAV